MAFGKGGKGVLHNADSQPAIRLGRGVKCGFPDFYGCAGRFRQSIMYHQLTAVSI